MAPIFIIIALLAIKTAVSKEEEHGIEIPIEILKESSIEDRLNDIPKKEYENSNYDMPCALNHGPLPLAFSWREQKKVSPVRDQLECSACWAFSMTATIESHLMIYRGADESLDLSEQMLIDCLKNSPGCFPGSMLESYANLVTQYGSMVTEEEYPFINGQRQCRIPQYNPSYSIAGFKRIPQNEEEMKRHLVMCGPLTAAINSASMKHFEAGTIDEPTEEKCHTSEGLDHAVEIVGYNTYMNNTTKDVTPYWIIKNSWGENWGDGGYYYLVLGRNACGISQDVTVPLVR